MLAPIFRRQDNSISRVDNFEVHPPVATNDQNIVLPFNVEHHVPTMGENVLRDRFTLGVGLR